MNSGILAGLQTDELQALQLSPISVRRCDRHFFPTGKSSGKNSRLFCIVGQNYSRRHFLISLISLCFILKQNHFHFFSLTGLIQRC
jgi:hypothetical protein